MKIVAEEERIFYNDRIESIFCAWFGSQSAKSAEKQAKGTRVFAVLPKNVITTTSPHVVGWYRVVAHAEMANSDIFASFSYVLANHTFLFR